MRRWIMCVACSWMAAATAATVAAQERPAYVIYDGRGETVDYGTMVEQVAGCDVLFVGEVHNCPIAHWMELELVRDLHARHGARLMVGAEMFERDDQLVVDEYVQGRIDAERFASEAKLWPNYATDYAPVVEYARGQGLAVVATNVPRRYARMVARGGWEALDSLADEARRYMAPLPLEYVANPAVERYFGTMRMPGMKAGQAEQMAQAQALKDATMAWSIARRLGEGVMVHLNGSFHSTGHAGIITYLERYRPGLRIATVEVVRQADVRRLDPEMRGRADFIICVPETMSRSY